MAVGAILVKPRNPIPGLHGHGGRIKRGKLDDIGMVGTSPGRNKGQKCRKHCEEGNKGFHGFSYDKTGVLEWEPNNTPPPRRLAVALTVWPCTVWLLTGV